jgi:hypothetical protein
LHGRERDEVAEILGEDGGDGTEGGGPDDGQLGPPEEKSGERAEGFQDVGEDATRTGEGACQLRDGESAEQGDQPTQDPGEQHGPWLLETPGDAGRNPEDAASDS